MARIEVIFRLLQPEKAYRLAEEFCRELSDLGADIHWNVNNGLLTPDRAGEIAVVGKTMQAELRGALAGGAEFIVRDVSYRTGKENEPTVSIHRYRGEEMEPMRLPRSEAVAYFLEVCGLSADLPKPACVSETAGKDPGLLVEIWYRGGAALRQVCAVEEFEELLAGILRDFAGSRLERAKLSQGDAELELECGQGCFVLSVALDSLGILRTLMNPGGSREVVIDFFVNSYPQSMVMNDASILADALRYFARHGNVDERYHWERTEY